MTAATAPVSSPPRRGALRAVALAGLAGGAVDVVYPTIVAAVHGRSLLSPWVGVASGWLGKAARDAGVVAVGLGLVTHFAIAFCMAAVYWLAAARLPILRQRPLASGALYGLVLYLVMYRLVLPLRFPQVFPRWDGIQSFTDIAAHVCVGLAIAWVISRGRQAREPRP